MNRIKNALRRVERPGRYIGGEINSVVKAEEDVDVRFAFAFPDLYDIGMSYIGMQILYNIINSQDDLCCERVYAPAFDMEKIMIEEEIPLFTLETKSPISTFDVLGFTLQYEMSFTTVLNMLALGNIPLRSKDRGDEYPVVIAGGPCSFNPEPLADFIDAFLIGDGEKLLPEVLRMKGKHGKKLDFLRAIAGLEGVYVPSFYQVTYDENGMVASRSITDSAAPLRVKKAIVGEIEGLDYPEKPLVPIIDVSHNRAVIETFRGCTRGCRFCQAGMIYRPVRERKSETVNRLARKQLENTGYEELSLLSLSTSDHSEFEKMTLELLHRCGDGDVSLSLPSLRLDSFSFQVLSEIQKYRKSGLTFAPEAGSQRLRDVINKNITEEDIFSSMKQALQLGWDRVKLYFMIGLPTETYEDLDGIVEIAEKLVAMNYDINGKRGGRFRLTISVSNFIPKPHTPFQWCGQDGDFIEKHNYLSNRLRRMKNVVFNYHDNTVSKYEALISKGNRETGAILETAWKNGSKLDGWSEHFDASAWEKAIDGTSLEKRISAYIEREAELPWDIVDSGITKKFLMDEMDKAIGCQTTEDCREACVNCGINSRTKCFPQRCDTEAKENMK